VSQLIYARKAVSARAWAIPFLLLAAFTVVMVLRDLPDFRTITVVASIGGWSPVLAVWLLTLWSMNRYGAITLTRDTLRVGRDRLPVSRIDPAWVRMLATRASSRLEERVLASTASFDVPEREISKGDRGRLLGGAYGATLGSDLVTLLLVDGERVSVQSGDREGLLGGLLTALDG